MLVVANKVDLKTYNLLSTFCYSSSYITFLYELLYANLYRRGLDFFA